MNEKMRSKRYDDTPKTVKSPKIYKFQKGNGFKEYKLYNYSAVTQKLIGMMALGVQYINQFLNLMVKTG